MQSQVSFCSSVGCVVLNLQQCGPYTISPVPWSRWFSTELRLEVLQTALTARWHSHGGVETEALSWPFSTSDGVSFFFILWCWGLNLRPQAREARTLPLCYNFIPRLLRKPWDFHVCSVQVLLGKSASTAHLSFTLSLPHCLDYSILESDSQSSSTIPGIIVSHKALI